MGVYYSQLRAGYFKPDWAWFKKTSKIFMTRALRQVPRPSLLTKSLSVQALGSPVERSLGIRLDGRKPSAPKATFSTRTAGARTFTILHLLSFWWQWKTSKKISKEHLFQPKINASRLTGEGWTAALSEGIPEPETTKIALGSASEQWTREDLSQATRSFWLDFWAGFWSKKTLGPGFQPWLSTENHDFFRPSFRPGWFSMSSSISWSPSLQLVEPDTSENQNAVASSLGTSIVMGVPQ